MTARSVAASSRPAYVHIAHPTRRTCGCTPSIAARAAPAAINRAMAIETSPGAEEIRKELDEQGVEFLFAQFVDMHGKPNAKLVPVAAPRRPAQGRRRVRRASRRATSARGRTIRTSPRCPTSRSLTPPAVEAGDRPLRLRRDRGGRAVAVLPAHDPAQPARPRGGAGLHVQDGLRARVLPRAPPPGRQDRARRPARRPRPALLRHARADALARLRHGGRAARQRARLGHLRDRPRGRERAVRAELPASTTRSSPATGRCSSATWSSRSPRSAG